MNLNDEYILKIIDTDNNGNGIAKVNNFVVFIKGCLQGELVKIKIISISKNYAIGQLLNVIEPNNNRLCSKCINFPICGGCDFLHISYDEEKKLKQLKINNLFSNYKVNSLVSSEEDNYRNKVVLHIKDNKIGFYEKKSNTIIEVDNCILLDNEINNVIKTIKKLDYSKLEEIMIKKTKFTNEIMICFKGNIYLDGLNIENTNIKSIYLNDKLIYGSSYIIEIINDIKYTIFPKSFFQVNPVNMINLYNVVKEYAGKGENLLDLYCGTGTIGIYLSDNLKKVIGIEKVSDAIKNANINKNLNNIDNILFKCIDVDKLSINNFDIVIVDPPRSGLTKITINKIIKIKPTKIVYVSCNPLTLKRDLQLFEELYEIKEITPIDMFPRTNHVECVVLLKYKN